MMPARCRLLVNLGLWCWSAALGLWACTPARAAEPVLKVCLEAEPPPWSYWVRDASGRKPPRLTGFSVELLEHALKRMGRRHEFITELPWARCLRSVARGEIDLALDAYFTPDRAEVLTYSVPYNTSTPRVWFLADAPLRPRSREELKALRGCGLRIRATDYPRYGLKPEDLQLVTDYPMLMVKLKSRECDFFAEELEVVDGHRRSGSNAFSGAPLDSAPVPGVADPRTHVVASLQPAGKALIQRLDTELTWAINSGEAARLWAKHAPDQPYRP